MCLDMACRPPQKTLCHSYSDSLEWLMHGFEGKICSKEKSTYRKTRFIKPVGASPSLGFLF